MEDESWLYYEYFRGRIWIAWDENTPEVGNKTMASSESMLAVYGVSTDSMLLQYVL
jgi:hypothetical protein